MSVDNTNKLIERRYICLRNYSHTILKTEYDKNTGVLLDCEKFRKVSKSKGGWRRMYKDYTKAQESCVKSLIDLKVWNFIIESVKSDFSLSLNITKIAKNLGVTRQKIHQFIKRLVESKVIIKKEDNSYEFNPFIYCPFGAGDEMIHSRQEEWKYTVYES